MSGSASGGELGLSALGGKPYDGDRLLAALPAALEGWRFGRHKRCATLLACRELAGILDGLEGECLQRRWERFEGRVWPRWVEGVARPPPHRWSLGPRLVVMSRAVRPGWPVLGAIAPAKWLAPLPQSDPLQQAAAELRGALSGMSWSGERMHDGALVLAVRIMLARGYGSLSEIVEADLCDVTLRRSMARSSTRARSRCGGYPPA